MDVRLTEPSCFPVLRTHGWLTAAYKIPSAAVALIILIVLFGAKEAIERPSDRSGDPMASPGRFVPQVQSTDALAGTDPTWTSFDRQDRTHVPITREGRELSRANEL